MQEIGGYPIHPACALLPMMPDAAIDELAEDIRRHGQQQPIWTYDGQLLDGRNRLLACLRAEVEADVREWQGDDPVRWVLSVNFHRRHLTDSQKAVVGARAETMLRELADADAAEEAMAQDLAGDEPAMGEASEDVPAEVEATTEEEAPEPKPAPRRAARPAREARRHAAALVNVSERAIARGRKLLDRAVPELVSAVERGAVPIAAASTIATLSAEDQQSIVEQGEEAVLGEARRIRRARTASRPTMKLALHRLDQELPEVRIEKALDGRWRIHGASPDLEEDLEVDEGSLREALLESWRWLDAHQDSDGQGGGE